MEKMVHKARFPADLQSLHPIIRWVRERAEKYSFSKKELYHIELAVEEAIVNIIRHGYQQKGGSIQIKIETQNSFHIEIEDASPPFNPLNKPPKGLSEAGGVGIDLLLHCMDEVTYERKGPVNLLIMKKNRKE